MLNKYPPKETGGYFYASNAKMLDIIISSVIIDAKANAVIFVGFGGIFSISFSKHGTKKLIDINISANHINDIGNAIYPLKWSGIWVPKRVME